MDLIIKLSTEDYNYITNLKDGITDFKTTQKLYKFIKDGLEISDDATNGDLLKILFPEIIIGFFSGDVIGVYFYKEQSEPIIFDVSWWNSPYKSN